MTMSDDLIRRSDAIDAVREYAEKHTFNSYHKGMLKAISIIADTPTADRPQGEWIYCEDEYGIDGYRCSHCGKHIPWDYQHKFINFIDDYHTCPFCDARMKGAEDD